MSIQHRGKDMDAVIELNIYKVGSWNHMGYTGNMIMKDFMRQMCVPFENSAYFGDGDGVCSNNASL